MAYISAIRINVTEILVRQTPIDTKITVAPLSWGSATNSKTISGVFIINIGKYTAIGRGQVLSHIPVTASGGRIPERTNAYAIQGEITGMGSIA